ncbi:MAG TPA: M56 family metallopeptidase [Cyclobacteriaceae bacterium]|nr:M48 family metalloprotease [Cyclobacteriaceae bacterium]HRK52852.1 M56 family metallopeptidase [Cyclobacteriaceae bacterium]
MAKYTLGWTLLHTLWQGAIIFGLTKIVLSFISSKRASLRYSVNCFALLLIIGSSILTFSYLNNSALASSASSFKIDFAGLSTTTTPSITDSTSFWALLSSAINTKMIWIITTWLVGVLIFSTRFIIGLIYIQQLKRRVIKVSTAWEQKLERMANQMGITRLVKLAESIHISKPIVLGYAKPIILLPLGLFSGLPAAQIETILIHELSHIKRNDYLVNLIQSVIEVILFFNPFVWLISETIRKEREHCCDDQVVSLGSSRIEYVRALAQLEQANQLRIPALAMALNKNKFHVFNRIKRIMETSANQNQSKVKPFVLATLIVVGLVSASWLTIGSDKEAVTREITNSPAVVADTTIRKDKDKEQKAATYSRQVITTYDEDGTPHQEVIENFEGDEELRPLMSDPQGMSFVVPPVPSIPSIPSIPSVPSTPSIPALPSIPFGMGYSYSFNGDTIPDRHFFSDEEAEKWKDFGREMEKRFEHFGADHEDFADAMEKWADNFGNTFQRSFDEDFGRQLEALTDQLKDMDFNRNFEFRFEDGLKEMEKHLERAKEKLKDHEAELKKVEKQMEEFENTLQEQLVKDGYLKKGEKVESMNWGNGKLTVNGIQIKKEDVPKYEALTEKYFNGNRGYYKAN